MSRLGESCLRERDRTDASGYRQMDVDLGVVECIARRRGPDGGIYRGPGHWQRIHSVGTNPSASRAPGNEGRPMDCVK